MIPTRLVLLSKADSNHHKQNQNLLCYHYTIGQLRMQRYDFFCSLTKFSHSFLSSDSILSVSKRTNVTFRLLYDTIRSSLRSAPTGYAFKTKRRKKPSSLNAQQKKRVCQYKTLTTPSLRFISADTSGSEGYFKPAQVPRILRHCTYKSG